MDMVPCYFQDSSHKFRDLGHILNKDLSIVKNNSIRKILNPKYREPKPLTFDKARKHIFTGLDNCISKWCNKKGLLIDILPQDWKHAVLENVDNHIKSLSSNLQYHTFHCLMRRLSLVFRIFKASML